ncbi:hypothetical protein CONPUDRAFT_131453 [Coniophora puteana RWD-64-598 SS2]|uniref:DNA endonuclease activator Ctp1 C-terminal domain-containing protein n=1 Tax=Coniophora puteana (strain RWD-64-598) TaxID=741705 RepID=A0A5M3MBE9_CONPW|nr:uncharacterized protein CONPUDRAFT_131453 [Coniophora puteana RWD-64-598 SS2]EIW75951.1 hypothetical protein CONPUDRAFT_131453 [Coniophora puteana RWD-64-598 SS2]
MPPNPATDARLNAALCAKVASLHTELTHLRQRYDALLEAKEQAEEKARQASEKQQDEHDKYNGFRIWFVSAYREGKHGEIRRIVKDMEQQLNKDVVCFVEKEGGTGKKKKGKENEKANEGKAETKLEDEVKVKIEAKEDFRVLGGSSAINDAPRRPCTPPSTDLPDFRDPHLLSTPGRSSASSGRSTSSPMSTSSKHIVISAHTTTIKSEPQSQLPSEHHHSPAHRAIHGSSRAENTTTINSAFTINPDANGGRAYAYDSVVRNRDERRHMDAGDCECCHAYYEGVGPMPPRLQQPLWRSPSTTPRKKKEKQKERFGAARTEPRQQHPKSRPYPSPHRDRTHSSSVHCRPAVSSSASASASTSGVNTGLSASTSNGGPSSRRKRRDSFDDPSDNEEAENAQRDIEAHKKAISKHRYHWQRAKTPPGYWDIGFPSTQEADALNARASAMHRDKMRAVEREAARGNGKYMMRK